MARLAVIMSVFNGAQTVAASMESILSQEYEDFAFVIVDDASTDATPEILARYARQDRRIRLVGNRTNQERCISRNTAIHAVDSEYVAIMDADDMAEPHRLGAQVEFLDSHPEVDVCGGYIELFGEGAGIQTYPVEHDAIMAHFLFSNPVAHSTVMGRRALFGAAPYDPDFRLAEDFELFSRMALLHGGRFHTLPEVLLRYRLHPDTAFRPWHVRVLRRNLHAMGLVPNERELELHAALALDPLGEVAVRYPIAEVLAWLDRLFAVAVTSGRMPRQSLAGLLCKLCAGMVRHAPIWATLAALSTARFIGEGGFGAYCRIIENISKNMATFLSANRRKRSA